MPNAIEIEQRILSLLDEFVSDNICALLNTVVTRDGDVDVIAPYQQALRNLLVKDMIIVSIDRSETTDYVALSVAAAMRIIDGIPDELLPRKHKMQWGWKSRKKSEKPYDVALPEIIATDTGLTEAKRVVQERGERWWR